MTTPPRTPPPSPSPPRGLPVARPDGTSFTVTLCSPQRADAPTVLVVPAMGLRAGWYRPLLESLVGHGLGAAVTELRGHEETGARRPGWRIDHGYADLVEDLAAAVATVTTHVGRPPVVLGHSLGGHIACAHASRDPDAMSGLVLVAAGSIHWRLWSLRHLVLTQSAALLAQILGHFPGHRFGFGGREARRQMADWARFARTGRLHFGRPAHDHTDDLARLRLPVLAISFDGDKLAPPASVDELLAALTNASATRHHLETADPSQPLDHLRWARHPEPVATAITTWLATQPHA